MFSSIIDYLKTLMRSRIFTLIVVYVVLFSILVGRLFYLQIVQGEAYDEQATIKNEKQKKVPVVRFMTAMGNFLRQTNKAMRSHWKIPVRLNPINR